MFFGLIGHIDTLDYETEECFSIMREYSKTGADAQLARRLLELAKRQFRLKDYKMTDQYAKAALGILDSSGQQDDALYADIFLVRARNSEICRMSDRAFSDYTAACRHADNCGIYSEKAAEARYAVGKFYIGTRRPESALRPLLEAYRIYEEFLHAVNRQSVGVLLRLTQCCILCYRPEEAFCFAAGFMRSAFALAIKSMKGLMYNVKDKDAERTE
jgi:tetratricopeptide (TPR) repeat protein